MKKSTVMWILMVLVALWIVVFPKINNKIVEPTFHLDSDVGMDWQIDVPIEETISWGGEK